MSPCLSRMTSILGAHERARTADLVLTKDVLYHLSYVGLNLSLTGAVDVERETGFEPATPSLEGSCSSQLSYSRTESIPHGAQFAPPDLVFCFGALWRRSARSHSSRKLAVGSRRARRGGEGGFEPRRRKPTDLQSAPFDRFGTSQLKSAGRAISLDRVLKWKSRVTKYPALAVALAGDREGGAVWPCPIGRPVVRSRARVAAARSLVVVACRCGPAGHARVRRCAAAGCDVSDRQTSVGAPLFQVVMPVRRQLELAMGLEPATC